MRLYLPRAVGAMLPASQRSGAPIELPHGSATILVVEDEPEVREACIAILRELGYRMLEAADGPGRCACSVRTTRGSTSC